MYLDDYLPKLLISRWENYQTITETLYLTSVADIPEIIPYEITAYTLYASLPGYDGMVAVTDGAFLKAKFPLRKTITKHLKKNCPDHPLLRKHRE